VQPKLFRVSTEMKDKITSYYNDVVAEMKKVSWPTKDQLRESTIVVLGVSAVLSVFTFLVDYLINSVLKGIL
jgi:preprotein translocase subunit SecE